MNQCLVTGNNLLCRTICQKRAAVDHQSTLANLTDFEKAMRHNNDRLPAILEVPESRRAFLLKTLVPYGKNFVDQQNIRIDLGGYRESQSHEHSARVLLYGRVNKIAQVRKIENLFLARLNVLFR